MNIILIDPLFLTRYIIPVVPSEATMSLTESKNTIDDTTETVGVKMGAPALRKLSWESYFPVSLKKFIPEMAHLNGWIYVAFLEFMRRNRLPIRVIGTSNNIPRYNFLATIEKFIWYIDKVGDIHYEIELREFPKTILSMANIVKDKYKDLENFVDDSRTQKLEQLGLLGKKTVNWVQQL